MIRIAGVNLDPKKQTRFAITSIKGIGKSNVKVVLDELGIDPKVKLGDLDEKALVKMRSHIEDNYIVEADLVREIKANIKRYKDTKSYRGLRHAAGMPVRGQRTKTNSRTVRGNKRMTAGSGRAGAAQKT